MPGLLNHIERHAVCAGMQIHRMKITECIDAGQNPSGKRIVLQIINHTVHLIHVPAAIRSLQCMCPFHFLCLRNKDIRDKLRLRNRVCKCSSEGAAKALLCDVIIAVLHRHLIPVGLSDRSLLVSPFIPDTGMQLGDLIGLLLPDPQKLIQRALYRSLPKRQNRELLLKVISRHHAKGLDRVGRCSVRPMRPDLLPLRRRPVLQNVIAHPDKIVINQCHNRKPPMAFSFPVIISDLIFSAQIVQLPCKSIQFLVRQSLCLADDAVQTLRRDLKLCKGI